MIYLDNASTTRIDFEVLEAMMPYLTNNFGNPGSIHRKGREAKKAVEDAKNTIKKCLGMKDEDKIIFTGSATEANNLAIWLMKTENGSEFVVDPCSHHSVFAALGKDSTKHREITVNNAGEFSMASVDRLLCEVYPLAGVSMSVVNSELGTYNDPYEVSKRCKPFGTLLHADFTQAIASYEVNLGKLECGYLASFSAHKIHGPKGIGMLCIDGETFEKLSAKSPLIAGGIAQEYGMRGGTENVAAIVGFAKAVGLATEAQKHNNMPLIKREFYNRLAATAGENAMRVNGQPFNQSKTLSITVNQADAETLVLMLDAKGVCVSAGSACMSGSQEPSHILKAVGMSDEESYSTVRFSFDPFVTNHVEYLKAAEIAGNVILTAV